MDGELSVVRQVLTDGSIVWNVEGFVENGKHKLAIGCVDLGQASELSSLLRRVVWIEVSDA